MLRLFTLAFAVAVFLAFAGCYGGLEPTDPLEKSFVRGRIAYVGGAENWPPPDSVKEIRAVAFKSYPPKDIFNEILSENAYFTPDTLPRFVAGSSYEIEIPEPPTELKYIAVAQRYGTIMEWLAIGVYAVEGGPENPTAVRIETGETADSIDITVDFDNLPPQPFE